jgi:hypothetical protein
MRGWDPDVDRTDRPNDADWIASWSNFAGRAEYWRLFQSGQFIHSFSFWEDAHPGSLAAAIEKTLTGVPFGAEPNGCIDVTGMLFRISEIYEFASRLVQKLELEGSVSISIELVDSNSEFSPRWISHARGGVTTQSWRRAFATRLTF